MNLKISFVFIFLIIAICPGPSASWEYCKPEVQTLLCGESKNHTVCDPSKAFKPDVFGISEKFLAHVPVTRKLIRVILYIHNDYRNRVAGGNESCASNSVKYPMASRMRELVWDTELMYVSHVHTRQVRFGHDYCRNTQRYRYSGQNLGFAAHPQATSIMEVLNKSLTDMYLEKDKEVDPLTLPDKFISEFSKVLHVGHFTLLVNDRLSRVGCAISIGTDCPSQKDKNIKFKWCYYLGCNYDGANQPGAPVYLTDPSTPGTQCSVWEIGKSTAYPNLCAPTKYFDPEEELDKYRPTAPGR